MISAISSIFCISARDGIEWDFVEPDEVGKAPVTITRNRIEQRIFILKTRTFSIQMVTESICLVFIYFVALAIISPPFPNLTRGAACGILMPPAHFRPSFLRFSRL